MTRTLDGSSRLAAGCGARPRDVAQASTPGSILKADELTVSEMRILDSHGQPMTVGGTVGVHERGVGAVNLYGEIGHL
jgi:hypothetical protein